MTQVNGPQPLMVDKILNFIQAMSPKAVVVIGGIEQQYDYYLTRIENNTVLKYVKLPDLPDEVTAAYAIDELGRHLEVYKTEIQQTPDGRMIVFMLAFKLEGMVFT